jgi:hypothetical protein
MREKKRKDKRREETKEKEKKEKYVFVWHNLMIMSTEF